MAKAQVTVDTRVDVVVLAELAAFLNSQGLPTQSKSSIASGGLKWLHTALEEAGALPRKFSIEGALDFISNELGGIPVKSINAISQALARSDTLTNEDPRFEAALRAMEEK